MKNNSSSINLQNTIQSSPKENMAIFLLVNPRSGSLEGRRLLQITPFQKIEISESKKSYVNIFNVTDSNQMSLFKHSISDFMNLEKLVVAIAGGDGTFMRVVKEIQDFGIDLDKLQFVQLPFGTSNDISRIFGWGSRPRRKMKRNLGFLCRRLDMAEEVKLDIWKVKIKTRSDGNISVTKQSKLVSTGQTEIRKLM
jgi:diacylglycerol kinase family enzyme